MEEKFTFNYEVIRDFAGTMIERVIDNINKGKQYHDVELWKILYVHAFPDALMSYCRSYIYYKKNYHVDMDNFNGRYEHMKELVVTNFKKNLQNEMIESLTGKSEIDFELIDEVFIKLGGSFDIANIVTHMLYEDKYLAFRGFAQHQNTDFARRFMLKYFFTIHSADWNGDLEEKNIFWGDLDPR